MNTSRRSKRLRSLVATSIFASFFAVKAGTGSELGGGDSTNADPAYMFISETFMCFCIASGSGPNRSVELSAKSFSSAETSLTDGGLFPRTARSDPATRGGGASFSPRFSIVT